MRANATYIAWELERHMGGGERQEWQQLQDLLLLLLSHMQALSGIRSFIRASRPAGDKGLK